MESYTKPKKEITKYGMLHKTEKETNKTFITLTHCGHSGG